ncbi:MAG: hypothetical protein NW201_10390 [Gemmatimonadales bacterium]|nr:hypothetical protein [Gemmatimonadales bacterium]
MSRHRLAPFLLLASMVASRLAAQAGPELAPRDSLYLVSARDPRGLLTQMEARLARDSADHEAQWRAALALVDLGREQSDSVKSARRDSLYTRAAELARRAIAGRPSDPEPHFVLAQALGRLTKSRGPRERLKLAAEIYEQASRTVALDSTHHGGWHVLGEWHFEMMKVSGMNRFFARTFLGARIFDAANWDSAFRDLERAVNLAPWHVFHRLTLAAVYADRGYVTAARQQLREIATLTELDAQDARYKREATMLLAKLADRKDKAPAAAPADAAGSAP